MEKNSNAFHFLEERNEVREKVSLVKPQTDFRQALSPGDNGSGTPTERQKRRTNKRESCSKRGTTKEPHKGVLGLRKNA